MLGYSYVTLQFCEKSCCLDEHLYVVWSSLQIGHPRQNRRDFRASTIHIIDNKAMLHSFFYCTRYVKVVWLAGTAGLFGWSFIQASLKQCDVLIPRDAFCISSYIFGESIVRK